MIRPPPGVTADRLIIEDRLKAGMVAAKGFEVRVVPNARIHQIFCADPMIDTEIVSLLFEWPHRDTHEIVAEERIYIGQGRLLGDAEQELGNRTDAGWIDRIWYPPVRQALTVVGSGICRERIVKSDLPSLCVNQSAKIACLHFRRRDRQLHGRPDTRPRSFPGVEPERPVAAVV